MVVYIQCIAAPKASGKSWLVQKLLAKLQKICSEVVWAKLLEKGLQRNNNLYGHCCKNVYILGDYQRLPENDSKVYLNDYLGTDRSPLNVMPTVTSLVSKLSKRPEIYILIIEGHRIVTKSFFEKLYQLKKAGFKLDYDLIILNTPVEQREQRMEQRSRKRNLNAEKGIETYVRNLAEYFSKQHPEQLQVMTSQVALSELRAYISKHLADDAHCASLLYKPSTTRKKTPTRNIAETMSKIRQKSSSRHKLAKAASNITAVPTSI